VFSKLSTSAPGPKQACVQWHREAERSPPSSADVKRCTSTRPAAIIALCYINKLQLIHVSPFFFFFWPRDKIE